MRERVTEGKTAGQAEDQKAAEATRTDSIQGTDKSTEGDDPVKPFDRSTDLLTERESELQQPFGQPLGVDVQRGEGLPVLARGDAFVYGHQKT